MTVEQGAPMSTLQELLNLGLVDIGGDDTRFDKMQSAASALAERLKKEPDLLIPATLVALDHDVDEADPVFDVVEELIIAEWRTLRNTHTNRPRELLRSILLDALSTVSDGSPEVAAVVWNTAAGPVRQWQTRLGKEASLVEQLLKKSWGTMEAEAVRRAALVPVASQKKRRRAASKTPALKVAAGLQNDELLPDVARAAGPQYAGKGLPDPNPHWPNSHQAWSQQFTPRMTEALVKAVNMGTDRLADSLKSGLASFMTAVEKRVADQLAQAEQLNEELVASTDAGRLRLDVLWWAEAHYSPVLGRGYRELPVHVAAVAAAADLAEIVPPLAPASVTYVLGEAVRRVAGAQSEEGRPWREYLNGLRDHGKLIEVLPVVERGGRSSLLDVVCEAAAGRSMEAAAITTRTGVGGDAELSAPEFAMWVFRDLQARRLVEELR